MECRARPSTVFAESLFCTSCLTLLAAGLSRWGRPRLLSDLDGRTSRERRTSGAWRRGANNSPGLRRDYSLTGTRTAWSSRAPRLQPNRKFRLGFSNASLDQPSRTAFVYSVEYCAVPANDLVSSFAVRDAGLDAARQARDVPELLRSGVDDLIVSAHDLVSPADDLAEAGEAPPSCWSTEGPNILPHVCFVTCDDYAIGDITAQWMAERLRGRGSIVLLSGLCQAELAHRRLDGARAVFARYPSLRPPTSAGRGS